LARIALPVSLHGDGGSRSYESEILNISEEGLFLSTEAPFEAGQRIKLVFSYGQSECHASGEMLWRSGPGGGVHLSETSDEYLACVRALAEMTPKEVVDALATITHPNATIK
jgi:hypothetical protein